MRPVVSIRMAAMVLIGSLLFYFLLYCSGLFESRYIKKRSKKTKHAKDRTDIIGLVYFVTLIFVIFFIFLKIKGISET